ncbi:MAG: 4-hydroxythreonine-4-phosphate dehydrogenase PdxA [Wenzhouxiangellaceae bacterium]|nr:4-hydroxythreonine-4-phosphate dehydrogenase PdxA [Wenzhouxiangellaceae bacterium]
MTDSPLLITPGEPAGIGPELAVATAVGQSDLVVAADPGLLEQAARRSGTTVSIREWQPGRASGPTGTDVLQCLPVPLNAPNTPGTLNPDNAEYVLETLRQAAGPVIDGDADGLVTGPVHKGVINDAGIAFSGHTEFLAALAGVERVVMMLVADTLRVALATTHLPLREVPDAIDRGNLRETLRIVQHDLCERFDIARPRIAVLGLNPHAGEGGHLGREEIDVIAPVIAELNDEGMRLEGPLPADTAFVPRHLRRFDAVLAMYHDQGLPVLKYAGFGHAVNVTLGLPFIRTSVDHGTALDLAGTGKADAGSLQAAIDLARQMTEKGGEQGFRIATNQ